LKCARHFFAENFGTVSEKVIFTKNCTEALNTAIFGLYKTGGKIITTVYEHNSVLRPLKALEKAGICTLSIVKPENVDIVTAIKNALTKDVCLIVTTAVSNVTGEILPVNLKEIKNDGCLGIMV